MRVLAIGATGFIGRHVLPLLVARGHEVALFRRGGTFASLPEGVVDIHGNRDRLADSRIALERFAPDVVLDLILYTQQQAQEMVDTFRSTSSRVVVLSSADVYRNYDGFRGKVTAPPDHAPLSETAPLRESRYPYRGYQTSFAYAHDYDKILVEQVVLGDRALPATVLRLPAVYGPDDTQHRVLQYLRRMDDGEDRILLAEGQASWRWTRAFVENVAAAIAFAVADRRGAGHIYNVGDEPTFTERDWVERIGHAAGWRGDVVALPLAQLPEELRQPMDWRYHLWTDTTALRSQLGYVPPVALDEALRRTIEWERSGSAKGRPMPPNDSGT